MMVCCCFIFRKPALSFYSTGNPKNTNSKAFLVMNLLVTIEFSLFFSSGSCCDTTTCSHRSASYVCRKGDECAFASKCSNLRGFDNYICPARVKKGDYKPCAQESQVCLDGVCSNSVCRRYDLTECQCSEKEKQCYVCCNFLGKCIPAILIPVVSISLKF